MRHRYTWSTESWVPWPPALVFAFFANPQNLPLLSPPRQKMRIEEVKIVAPPPAPATADAMRGFHNVAAGVGSAITLSFRPSRISLKRTTWEARIAEFVWNQHLCDEQVRGPFAFWQHFHRVKEHAHQGAWGTLIIDQIAYELPLGPIGSLAHALFVRRRIEQMFAYRQKRLAEILARTGKVFQKAGAQRFSGLKDRST
ncbi:SRPBCC family protein [Paracidobacterium acidisoli]|uniref:SRPBCC family protein n=1 Tax=Paracidobacterium acidisoli TaxID=2303751 RepID=UPI0018F18948|nr:SRPBCC family protein [Paracidobacterium acidisoli]MBT9332943.1 SRPBCC family protein [Paracidobacterium acidisoli]